MKTKYFVPKIGRGNHFFNVRYTPDIYTGTLRKVKEEYIEVKSLRLDKELFYQNQTVVVINDIVQDSKKHFLMEFLMFDTLEAAVEKKIELINKIKEEMLDEKNISYLLEKLECGLNVSKEALIDKKRSDIANITSFINETLDKDIISLNSGILVQNNIRFNNL